MADKYKKAKQMIVTRDQETKGYIWFMVKSPSGFSYRVSFHKLSGMFRCECRSFIHNEMCLCSHMIACMKFIDADNEVLQV